MGVVDTGVVRKHQDLFANDIDGHDFIADSFSASDRDGEDEEFKDPSGGDDCTEVRAASGPLVLLSCLVLAPLRRSRCRGL